jgi:hypothetical protein
MQKKAVGRKMYKLVFHAAQAQSTATLVDILQNTKANAQSQHWQCTDMPFARTCYWQAIQLPQSVLYATVGNRKKKVPNRCEK